MPSKEALLTLRSGNFREFSFFIEYFVACVVRRDKFNKCIKDGMKFTSYVTPSDEAYTLMVLDKNYEHWKWLAVYLEGDGSMKNTMPFPPMGRRMISSYDSAFKKVLSDRDRNSNVSRA